eukprot:TRINITY_DN10151_c0_g1_i1.p1 TRINITY_DN10151_c0_g1~~TRINITY_DN10151_c0_g1_i1.p1  ORF type:complete len:290 (+),score=50.29 TRINITY_DN10151_c0_g1_i1:82-951(+)
MTLPYPSDMPADFGCDVAQQSRTPDPPVVLMADSGSGSYTSPAKTPDLATAARSHQVHHEDLRSKLARLVAQEKTATAVMTNAAQVSPPMLPSMLPPGPPPALCLTELLSPLADEEVLDPFVIGGGLAAQTELLPPRPVEVDIPVREVNAPASAGSRGHPLKCRAACKYLRRKGGCREGAACTFCHECRFLRASNTCDADAKGKAARPPTEAESAPIATLATAADFAPTAVCPTVGSFGHPFACAPPCKYNCKPRGCKDGRFCDRCHLCRWNRQSEMVVKTTTHRATRL